VLFKQQRLQNVEGEREIIMNSEERTYWKQLIAVYGD
jgi:hypothetical protein